MNQPHFTRVPAIDKCFAILDLLIESPKPMGISELSRRLGLNKSTVFNISHTLISLGVLENQSNGKFTFGTVFYVLSNMARRQSSVIHFVRRYLEKISMKTNLSAFLGLRSDCSAILIDRIDPDYEVKLSSEIGTHMPAFAGAGIKAMLSQLSDEAIDQILASNELERYTASSIIDKAVYKKEVLQVRKHGIAYDLAEYIDGTVGFAIPVKVWGEHVQAAIWAAGFKNQISERSLPFLEHLLLNISEEIKCQLA